MIQALHTLAMLASAAAFGALVTHIHHRQQARTRRRAELRTAENARLASIRLKRDGFRAGHAAAITRDNLSHTRN